jgi:hypothetical protein
VEEESIKLRKMFNDAGAPSSDHCDEVLLAIKKIQDSIDSSTNVETALLNNTQDMIRKSLMLILGDLSDLKGDTDNTLTGDDLKRIIDEVINQSPRDNEDDQSAWERFKDLFSPGKQLERWKNSAAFIYYILRGLSALLDIKKYIEDAFYEYFHDALRRMPNFPGYIDEPEPIDLTPLLNCCKEVKQKIDGLPNFDQKFKDMSKCCNDVKQRIGNYVEGSESIHDDLSTVKEDLRQLKALCI